MSTRSLPHHHATMRCCEICMPGTVKALFALRVVANEGAILRYVCAKHVIPQVCFCPRACDPLLKLSGQFFIHASPRGVQYKKFCPKLPCAFFLRAEMQIPKKRVQSTVIPKRKGSRRLISQKSGKGGNSRASHFPKKLKVLRFSKGKAESTKHQVFSKKEDSEDQAPSFPKRRLEEPSFPPPPLSKKRD